MTTEYRPTTTGVRERFVDGFPMDTWVLARAECAAEFDRWLAAHDARVRAEALRHSGVCSPTTRGLLDDAQAALEAQEAKIAEALAVHPKGWPSGLPCTCQVCLILKGES